MNGMVPGVQFQEMGSTKDLNKLGLVPYKSRVQSNIG